ncbi:MAG TPA: DUF5657 family protein [Patescibacteria group bacterium]
MPTQSSGVDFVDKIFNFSISSGVVIFLLLFVVFYVIFSIILIRQLVIMAKSITTSLGGILKFLSIINLFASLLVLLIALSLI